MSSANHCGLKGKKGGERKGKNCWPSVFAFEGKKKREGWARRKYGESGKEGKSGGEKKGRGVDADAMISGVCAGGREENSSLSSFA